MTAMPAPALRAIAGLAGVAVLATGLLAGMHALTRERIDAAKRTAQKQALAIVLPSALYDNAPLLDEVRITAPAWLGTEEDVSVHRARRGGSPTALVLEAVAREGYGGPISLLIGVDRTGRITGVRVTAHKETPGLGDAIDIRRSGWIRGFDGRALGNPPDAGWAVKRDGGDFDQLAGATSTPRTVVKAVHRVLEFVRRHGDRIYAAPSGTSLRFDDAPESPTPATGAPR
ncbi:electron transport complex subunit RsxG [Arenimonas sp.]|uniref:electron transport complex subunit RsxG n=1 Tax=Arenimonas sp. TaxID=1872635 RepID=UPI0039E39827